MGQKTLLRFSKKILEHLPAMAIDSIEAAQGNVVSWMHIGERVIGSIGDTVEYCLEHNNIKKITSEYQRMEMETKQDLNKMEVELLIKAKISLEKIRKEIQDEQKKLETHIQQERLKTKKLLESEIPNKEIDLQIQEQVKHKTEIIERKAEIEKKRITKKAELSKKELERQIQEKEILTHYKDLCRKHLCDALHIFDEQISKCSVLGKLPEEKQLQLEEQYHVLFWQYNKEIII